MSVVSFKLNNIYVLTETFAAVLLKVINIKNSSYEKRIDFENQNDFEYNRIFAFKTTCNVCTQIKNLGSKSFSMKIKVYNEES